MKKIFVLLLVVLLLCSCADVTKVQNYLIRQGYTIEYAIPLMYGFIVSKDGKVYITTCGAGFEKSIGIKMEIVELKGVVKQ